MLLDHKIQEYYNVQTIVCDMLLGTECVKKQLNS